MESLSEKQVEQIRRNKRIRELRTGGFALAEQQFRIYGYRDGKKVVGPRPCGSFVRAQIEASQMFSEIRNGERRCDRVEVVDKETSDVCFVVTGGAEQ